MNEFYARQELERADRLPRQQARQRGSPRRRNGNGNGSGGEDGARSKKKDCVIM